MRSKFMEDVTGEISVDIARDLFAGSATGLLELGVTPKRVWDDMLVAQTVHAAVRTAVDTLSDRRIFPALDIFPSFHVAAIGFDPADVGV